MQKVKGLCSLCCPIGPFIAALSSYPIPSSYPSGYQRKQSAKQSQDSDTQDQLPSTTVAGCDFSDGERSVEVAAVTSPAPIVSGEAVVAKRTPPICEGELCGVSISAMQDGMGYAFGICHLLASLFIQREPCGFTTFFDGTMVTHVTARDLHVIRITNCKQHGIHQRICFNSEANCS